MKISKIAMYKNIPIYFDPLIASDTITAAWITTEKEFGEVYFIDVEGKILKKNGFPLSNVKNKTYTVKYLVCNCQDNTKIQEMCLKYEDLKGIILTT